MNSAVRASGSLVSMAVVFATMAIATGFVGPSQAVAQEPALKAGAATSNVTPRLGTSMNGHFVDRQAVHVHDELHARALVLDNGQTRIALVAVDSCVIERGIFDEAKRMAEERTGIPANHMLMSATHTHSGGTATAVLQSEPDPEYQAFLTHRIADAVVRAANNLEPAVIAWGTGGKPEHLFNRRWYMKEGTIAPNPFGGTTDRVQMNPPRESPNLVEPAGPTDPQVGVLAVRSSEGRPIALVANYGLHYIGDVGPSHISADYFGVFADRIQALLDADRLDPPFVGMLTNGTSGDVNNINFRQAAPVRQRYQQSRTVAGDVAAEALRVLCGATYRDRIVLEVRNAEVTLGVRRPSDQDIEQAKAILAAAGPGPWRKREEIYAGETLRLADYPPSVSVPLQVIRIGDAAIAAIPCEVFAEIGLEIKAKSPFKPTTVISLANGYNGYLPTPAQHALGGYETWRARSSYLEVDASTKIVDPLLTMLESVKAERGE